MLYISNWKNIRGTWGYCSWKNIKEIKITVRRLRTQLLHSIEANLLGTIIERELS